jgi:valine--pyruvate aminotransferase
MNKNYSKFGQKFTRYSGITQLMDDLGKANHSDDENIIMLGGGNPALIPEAHDIFVSELKALIDNNEGRLWRFISWQPVVGASPLRAP